MKRGSCLAVLSTFPTDSQGRERFYDVPKMERAIAIKSKKNTGGGKG